MTVNQQSRSQTPETAVARTPAPADTLRDPTADDFPSMYEAVGTCDVEAVRYHLQTQSPNGMYQSFPYIAHAASRGNIELVEMLLDAGADIDATVDTHTGFSPGLTALYYAVVCERPAITRLLLSRGANPDGVDGTTVLPRALEMGRSVIAGMLMDHGASTAGTGRDSAVYQALHPFNVYSGDFIQPMDVYRGQVRDVMSRGELDPWTVDEALTERTPAPLREELQAAKRGVFEALEDSTPLPLELIQKVGSFLMPTGDQGAYPPIDYSEGRYRFNWNTD